MQDITVMEYANCKQMLDHLYKITVNIRVAERTALVVSYREDDSIIGKELSLDGFSENFDELDEEAREKLTEILSPKSLSEVYDSGLVKKVCFTVQPRHNIYDKYTIALYPDRREGKIYMTVVDYEHTDNIITLMFKKNAVNIKLSDIFYVDYGNHSVEIHTTSGCSSFFSVSFSDVADRLLKHHNFLRSYKNCIVNMDRIKTVSQDSFILDNGESISIPKRRIKEIVKNYDNYQLMK